MKDNPLNLIDIPSFFQELSQKIDTLQNEVKSLKDLYNQSAGAKTNNPYSKDEMNLDETITYLPTHPSKSTVSRWIKEKGMPVRRMGRRIYFNRKEVDEWYNNQSDLSQMEVLNRMVANSIKTKQNKMKSFKVISA